MEENMNTNEQTTQAENMGRESGVQGTAQEGGGKDNKLFTQEEVNGFVQSRIARMKGQINKEAKAEYDQKLTELQAREMKLMVKEKLDERGMSRELADIITCTDEEDLNSKLDALNKIYGGSAAEEKEKPTGFIQIGASGGGRIGEGIDPVRNAMGLDKR
ncbi:MAG: hypothetical protein U0I51_23585 [Muricomes sp.]|nr:hypothetical protein [Muricomes sp.]